MFRIGKEYRFEAAHHLPNHDGKCQRPHGHSYKVEVVLVANNVQRLGGSKEGMVRDFGDLDTVMNRVIVQLDHTDLNDSVRLLNEAYNVYSEDDDIPTTAENLAALIWHIVSPAIIRTSEAYQHDCRLHSVRVWETAKSWAEYTP